MPEYLSPGVYGRKIEIGAKPIEGVSTSTAGFLGPTERGPERALLVTGSEQFRQVYGGCLANSFLAYAIEGFFSNGGKRCYVGRVAPADAVAPSATLDTINLTAIGVMNSS